LTGNRDIATSVRMSGPIGAVTGQLSDHAEAVVTEAISNAVRHSGATRLTVTVTVGDEFSLDVTDDGHGISPENERNSGLANMRRRAELLGGTCAISSARDSGTTVSWTAPVLAE
jgi:signal transduction histidine kinase